MVTTRLVQRAEVPPRWVDRSAIAPARRLTTREQILLSCFWFGASAHWGALLPVVLPSQTVALVGDTGKELYGGILLGAGAAVSALITPLAGAASDRSRSRWGRRLPFMVAGTSINALFLLALSSFGPGHDRWWFLVCYMGVQLGHNWGIGPYAGLIPDVVPDSQRGSASGWLSLMTASGTLAGALAAGQLLRGVNYRPIYVFTVIVMTATLALTSLRARGPAAMVEEQPIRAPPPPKARGDFYWVLLTRGLVTMSVYSVFTFLQFFLRDVVQIANVEEQTSWLVAAIVAAGVPTSIAAGALSDRWGRKPIIYASGATMTATLLVYALTIRSPSLELSFLLGALFGAGYGAYQAVDWALALDALPERKGAAESMGIWHLSLVLPQVFAPALTGCMLHAARASSLARGYVSVFVLAAIWMALGTLLVRQIRSIR